MSTMLKDERHTVREFQEKIVSLEAEVKVGTDENNTQEELIEDLQKQLSEKNEKLS